LRDYKYCEVKIRNKKVEKESKKKIGNAILNGKISFSSHVTNIKEATKLKREK